MNYKVRDIEVMLKESEGELGALKITVSKVNREYRQKMDEVKNLTLSLEKEKMRAEKKKDIKDVVVTDHALVRYIERYKGFNIDTIKDEIMTGDAGKAALAFGSVKIPVGNGVVAVIKDGVIITFI